MIQLYQSQIRKKDKRAISCLISWTKKGASVAGGTAKLCYTSLAPRPRAYHQSGDDISIPHTGAVLSLTSVVARTALLS